MSSVTLGFAGILVTVTDDDVFDIAPLVNGRLPADIAVDIGVSTRTVQRWIASGVAWDTADVFVSKILGRHALDVFGPRWHEAAERAAPHDDSQLTLGDVFDFL